MRPMLFLVVDGVPLEMARAVWEAGELSGFEAPRPMVSCFPSLTTVAVPALASGVQLRRPPSYEPRWYDLDGGAICGGVDPRRIGDSMQAYRTEPGGAAEHVVQYALGRWFAFGEVRWIGRRFRREGAPWLGYLSSTDAIGHFLGEAALHDAFVDVCRQVERGQEAFARAHGRRPGVVLCSDHGFAFGALRQQRLEEVEKLIRAAGLGDEAHLAPFGDVAGGAVWCRPERALRVAEVMATVPGVELAFAKTGDGFVALRVRDGLEEAHVDWEGGRYRYRPAHGDPLDLGPLLEAGWYDEAELLHLTWDHRFPDPLARVREGLTELVEHPAPVLFSMADGWTLGPRLIQAAAAARGGQVGTHGSLTRAQSLGFATATHPRWPREGVLRAREVFAPWGSVLRARRRGPRR